MKHISKRDVVTLMIAALILGSALGWALGLKIGYMDGVRNVTEVRNQMLGLNPFDASLPIRDLEYYDITPSGVTITFNTDTKTTGEIDYRDYSCEWSIYPSDIFTRTDVAHVFLAERLYRVVIQTYPEGGTLVWRIVDNDDTQNSGSLWQYIDLPRPAESVLPPPYKK